MAAVAPVRHGDARGVMQKEVVEEGRTWQAKPHINYMGAALLHVGEHIM